MKRLALVALAACGGGGATGDRPTLPPVTTPTGPAPEVAWNQLEGAIKTVTVKSEDATEVAAAKQMLAAEVGKPLDRARLRGELAQVLGIKGVGDVSASAVQLADGVELVVTLAPARTLHALTAKEAGGQDIALPGLLSTAAGLPLDPALLAKVVEELRAEYLAKGFTDVQVAWKDADTGSNQVDVSIEITPGKATTITTVEFKGNAHAKKTELLKAIEGTLVPSSPWNNDLVDRASLLVSAYYYDHGYINVAVDTPKPSGGSSPATFAITEGDQFRVGKIDVKGVPDADAKKYLAMVTVKKGDVFSRKLMQDGILKIQTAAQTQVEPVTNIDAKKKTIDVTLDLTKH
ncbi:MAG TPA: POTRA domain-containing protein [Kofleriaceae bacterium]|nr:POTRA domain-containing protein [Kofleriaceae bacterium]